MNLFRTVVGIDPSGRRLALSAVRYGLGRPSVAVPPAVFELRGDREQARLEEAGNILSDFVARNGLAGGEARLAIPADKVFFARVSLPPLKEKDLRPALALELDRLFPFPASRLKFHWRRAAPQAGGKNVPQVVAAAPSDYIDRWEELVSRAGLTLVGAVPSACALSAACEAAGEAEGKAGDLRAVLRGLDGMVECAVMEGAGPLFSSARACSPESAPEEAISLLEAALVDAPPSVASGEVRVIAPAGWRLEGRLRHPGEEVLRPVDGFESRAANAMAGPEGPAKGAPVWEALGAHGAALCENGLDLLSPEKEGAGFRAWSRTVTGALAAVTALLALSWPAAVALRTNQELRRLDGEIASLQPAVARVEDSLAALGEIEGRIFALREEKAGSDEPLRILRDLTDSLPPGTWLTGLRMEDRKVELDGLSPSANEIFPLLSRDGRFRKVEFVSPITRQADNLERFQIRSEYAPSSSPQGREGEKP